MTVDPEAIRIVLEQSTVPKAAELDPKRFLRQHAHSREVNRDYASKLFSRPGEMVRVKAVGFGAKRLHPPYISGKRIFL